MKISSICCKTKTTASKKSNMNVISTLISTVTRIGYSESSMHRFSYTTAAMLLALPAVFGNCNLPDYPSDSLALPMQTTCSFTSAAFINCTSASEDEILDQIKLFTEAYPEQHTTSLAIDCGGTWVNFTMLSRKILASGLELSAFSMTNCQFVTGTFGATFEGQQKSLKQLSITCCTFTSKVLFPVFTRYTMLQSLTMRTNRLYPVEEHSTNIIHSSYYTDFTMYGINMTQFEEVGPLQTGRCFWSRHESISVLCFDILETDLVKIAQKLNIYSNVSRLNVFGLTVNNWSGSNNNDDDLANEDSHIMKLALHLCRHLPNMLDLRIKKCHWSTENITGETPLYDLSDCLGRLVHLELSNCTPPRDKNEPYVQSDFLTLLYRFPKSLRHVDLNTNGIFTFEGLFDPLPYESLILYGNNLTEVTSASFLPFATTLKNLSLRYNDIDSIKLTAFQRLTKLCYLDIANNQFTAPEPAWFKELSNLQELFTGFFDKLNLVSDNFDGIKTLKLLRLPRITHPAIISQNTFRGLGATLETLQMSDSDYANVPHSLLRPLFSLRKLDFYKAGGILKRPGASRELLSYAETVQHLVYNLDTLKPPCGILGRMPLLRELTIGETELTCSKSELFKWLQHRVRDGKLSIYKGDRVKCKSKNVSLEQYLAATDFSTVKLTKIPNPPPAVSDVGLIKQLQTCTSSNATTNDLHSKGTIAFAVCVPLIVTAAFLYCCLRTEKRKRWFNSNWRQWLCDEQDHLVRRFYETTSFDGFAHVLNTKSLAEKVFWHLLIILFISLTAQNLAQLYVEWQYGNPTTSLDLVNNATFCNHPFTICMPVVQRNVTLTDEQLEAFFVDSAGCRPADQLPYDLGLFLDVLMHRIGLEMLAEMSLMPTMLNSTFYNVTLLDKRLNERNITYRQLLRNISSVLCYALGVETSILNETSSGVNVQVKLNASSCAYLFQTDSYLGLTWYDDQVTKTMCLRFPGLFSFAGNLLEAKLSMQPWRVVNIRDEFTVDLDGYPTRYGANLLGNPISVPAGASTRIDMAVDSIVDMLQYDRSTSKPRCYDRCFQTYRVPDIQKRCACRPLMWPTDVNSNPSLPDCTVENILQNCSETPGVDVCTTSIPCETRKHTIAVYKAGETPGGETAITFRINNNIFTSTTQGPSMTASDLIGNLGGVLTFWLSVSFMGIIHFVLYCVRFLVVGVCYCCAPRRKIRSGGDPRAEVATSSPMTSAL